MKKLILLFCTLFVLSACNQNEDDTEVSVDSNNYPEREITIVIPYAAGGSADLQARFIGNYMQEKFGVRVNVEARPGGAGSIGMSHIQHSTPDGYTIILTAVGPSTLTPNLNDVGYDVVEDFKPISQITEGPYGLAVNSKSEFKTLDNLFNASTESNTLNFGTTGAGLHQHVLMTALLDALEHVEMNHIPFDGGAEAVTALLGQHIDSSVNTVSEIIPHEESEDLNILAVTSKERLDVLPEVPTFNELGYDLIGTGAWFAFMAQKDTPDEVIKILDDTINEALQQEDIIKQYEDAGLVVSYLNNEELTKKVTEENKANAKVMEIIKGQ